MSVNKGDMVDFLFAKLFLLNQPNGITTIAAGSEFDLIGGNVQCRFILFQPGELGGTFASIQNDYFNGTEKWIAIYDNADGYVELEAAPAPEPSSLLLLSSGLLSLAYGMRRRWM